MAKLLLSVFILFFSMTAFSQSVGIGTDTPEASAILDIAHDQKGVLLPRLTTAQRTGIANAAEGLMVFDIETESFWWHGKTDWIELISSNIGLRDKDADTRVEVESSTDSDVIDFVTKNLLAGRFFENHLYINNRLSLGTTAKRGMFTIRGPNNSEFGPSIFMYGTQADQLESGRIRFVEGTALTNWRGGYIHYSGSGNLLHLGVHNTSDNDVSEDKNALSIRRDNAHVGIHTLNPSHTFSVNGGFKIENEYTTTTADEDGITITTASGSVIEISESGNITLTGIENLNITANNINLNSNNTLTLSAGTEIDLSSPIINLNSNNENPAARLGDGVQVIPGSGTGSIIQGSSSVFIGG